MPQYGILQAINSMQTQDAPHPIIGELLNAHKAFQDAKRGKEESAIRQAQMRLYGIQGDTAQKQLEFMPEQQRMDMEKHAANLAMNQANIGAIQSQAKTADIQRQQTQQEMNLKNHAFITQTLGALNQLPPELQQDALNAAIKHGKSIGMEWPKGISTDVNNPETKAFLQNMYAQSGQALKMAEAQQKANQLPLEKVINPETGEPMFVRREQAVGMQPYNEKQGTQTFQQEKALRDEHNKQTQTFVAIKDYNEQMKALAKNPSPANDIGMVYTLMKLYDPTSVVREGEFATAQNSAGIPEQIRATYNSLVAGKGMLTPKIRADFLKAGNDVYSAKKAAYDKSKKETTRIAKNYGLNPENIIVDYEPNKKQASAVEVGSVVTGANGKQYRKVQGGYELVE